MEVRIATQTDMSNVYKLTYQSYLKEGYCKKNDKEELIHYPHLDNIEETTVIVVYEDENIVGTISLTLDGINKLYIDEDFPEETESVRQECFEKNKNLGCLWRLATITDKNNKAIICLLFNKTIEIIKRENVIFEGAQGLLLDPEYGTMPHCTRSNCGLKNIVELCDEPCDVYYVSRPYMTRHGAGPLPFERPIPNHVIDKTNQPNEFQGSLRYSPLNLDKIAEVISKEKDKYSFIINKCFAVMSCLDQIDDEYNNVEFIQNNEVRFTYKDYIGCCYANAIDGRFVDISNKYNA